MIRRFTEWLDARSGYRTVVATVLGGSVHGGSRWGHVFGITLVALLALEALTGVGLSAWYAPTTTGAWASVEFIQNHVALGWVLRGLHHYGASAIVIVLGLHLLQTLWYGAYRAPKELNWIVGLLLMQVVIIASHTGFLLPNDLRAYWASQTLLSITGNQPVVGDVSQTLIQGGPAFGNATLTHFYALHAFLLPGGIVAMLVLHVALRRRYGATAPPGLTDADAAARTQPTWPNQTVKDLAASAGCVLAVLAVVVINHGAELAAPADPAIEYIARPEWYFMPVFQLRHYFTGSSEFVATTVLPGAGVAFLLMLPFIHARLAQRTANAHRLLVGVALIGAIAFAGLGAMSELEDRRNPENARVDARARALSLEAQRLAQKGVPITGPLDLYKNDPLVWGERVFSQKCATCHSPCDVPKEKFEGDLCLEGYASRTWLKKFLLAPKDVYFFGNTKIDGMDAWEGDEQKLAAIVEFVYSQTGRKDVKADDPKVIEGGRLYASEGCESCHSLDGKGTGDAPDLKGWAGEAWLAEFIRTPDAAKFYGKENEMDAFPHEKLAADELKAVIAYLRSQDDARVKFP